MSGQKAAKKEPPIIEEAEDTEFETENSQLQYDRARRPSGLAMHPLTSEASEHISRREEHDGNDVGRAV